MPLRGCTCLKRNCRRGRALCRRQDNPRNLNCNCPAYHFVHRIGSGRCLSNPKGVERMNAVVYGSAP